MTKTQFLPIFLGRRYARSQYFWVQNFQGIHVLGFEFYPPYAHPCIQIYEVPPWGLDLLSKNLVGMNGMMCKKCGSKAGLTHINENGTKGNYSHHSSQSSAQARTGLEMNSSGD